MHDATAFCHCQNFFHHRKIALYGHFVSVQHCFTRLCDENIYFEIPAVKVYFLVWFSVHKWAFSAPCGNFKTTTLPSKLPIKVNFWLVLL